MDWSRGDTQPYRRRATAHLSPPVRCSTQSMNAVGLQSRDLCPLESAGSRLRSSVCRGISLLQSSAGSKRWVGRSATGFVPCLRRVCQLSILTRAEEKMRKHKAFSRHLAGAALFVPALYALWFRIRPAATA